MPFKGYIIGSQSDCYLLQVFPGHLGAAARLKHPIVLGQLIPYPDIQKNLAVAAMVPSGPAG